MITAAAAPVKWLSSPRLYILARRVNQREGSKVQQLQKYYEQGRDLEALHGEFVRLHGPKGGWKEWVQENVTVCYSRTGHYRALFRWLNGLVTSPSAAEQWAGWQRFSGNGPRPADDGTVGAGATPDPAGGTVLTPGAPVPPRTLALQVPEQEYDQFVNRLYRAAQLLGTAGEYATIDELLSQYLAQHDQEEVGRG